MKTIVIKTEIEQFKEQYPELYQEIFDLGYSSYRLQAELYDELYDKDKEPPYEPEPEPIAKREDSSERFYIYDSWHVVNDNAEHLDRVGYTSRMDWKRFMNNYKGWDKMYIVWNPTHKVFAVESDISVIDAYYPHLVNATHISVGPL
jgi:hypothetical protein